MGMIFASNLLLGKTLSPLEGIINSWKQVSEFKKSFASIKILADNQNIQEFSIELGQPIGNIVTKDLSLNLNKNTKPTLKNINLIINAGTTTAIIGPSGAGKTSLLKLLSGIYKANEGFVYLDNSDLTKRDFNDLGKYIGYLSQTTDLLAGKVSEISGSAKNTGGQYLVKVTLNATDKAILSGMFVNVQFPIANKPKTETTIKSDKVMVPESALVKQGQLTGIYTIANGKTAILRWIRTGKSFGNQVEVLSGLSSDEQYIVSAEGKLFNGAKVSVQ